MKKTILTTLLILVATTMQGQLTVKGCAYQWCVLSFNVYEVRGAKFVTILNSPLYYKMEKTADKHTIAIQPEETILLKKKRKYYISMAIVDSDGYGSLKVPSQMKSGYARRAGKMRKLPVAPAILVKGISL